MQHEGVLRLGFFAGILAILAVGEILAPRRRHRVHKPLRWLNNLALVGVNTLALRFLIPLAAIDIALVAQENGWGLFNNSAVPPWLAVLLSVILLDLAIYLQHVMVHAVPLLWRLHMVHHADLDVDASTGLRFHTIEILLSMGIKIAVVVLLGAPALGVLIFEILLNATSMFNHANLRLPLWLDRLVRLVIVTPDMHRVHHSVLPRETNSNFGFNLPWWDWLFGTYRSEPAAGHEDMALGITQCREERTVDRLPGMLALPFVGSLGNYPVNRPDEPGPSEARAGVPVEETTLLK
jgi:sterol desaturase/sphingolipid hydroxylase (fatty acid hydroxylase superfamily)